MQPPRRRFLKLASGAAAVAALPFAALRSRRVVAATPWGPLEPDPEGILDLPRGFSYRILERTGDPMSDGFAVPGRPDGMACFEGEPGTYVLMRNHELSPGSWDLSAYTSEFQPNLSYDPGSLGGVTRLVVDADTFERVSSNLVLTGTNRNCAGGTSPWGWLSCEENLAQNHGYVFLCDPAADGLRAPEVKTMYGRFNHEAACVHFDTLVCYLTEDAGGGCFYRFKPDDPSTPFEGRLQALRAVDYWELPTGQLHVGDTVAIDWVDIDDPDAGSGVALEARGKGAAVFVRGEGLWIDGDDIWICCTSGGPKGRGQIFKLNDGEDGGVLELVAHADDILVLDMPDNICVSPWGQVYMAEDGTGDQFVRVMDTRGVVRSFARNAKSSSEFAGVCFSPDGRALFVNMQHDGLTLVITGPFDAWELGPCDDPGGDGDSDGEDAGESGNGGLTHDGGGPEPYEFDEGIVGCACASGAVGGGANALLCLGAVLWRQASREPRS